jgi:hypothetical protein
LGIEVDGFVGFFFYFLLFSQNWIDLLPSVCAKFNNDVFEFENELYYNKKFEEYKRRYSVKFESENNINCNNSEITPNNSNCFTNIVNDSNPHRISIRCISGMCEKKSFW